MAFTPKQITKELDFANLAKHNDNYNAIKTELDAHDTHVAAQTAHGSTSAATAGKIVQRDSAGRAKVSAPAAADDIARKAEVDTVQDALDTHEADVAVHLSAADKAKLDGIEDGAEPNQNAFAQVNNVAAASESDTLTITGGTGITISTNPTTKTVTVTATGTATPGAHGSSHNNDGSDPIPDLVALRGEFDALTAADIGAETPEGAQEKVDALAGAGNTKTVAEVADEVADVTAQLADLEQEAHPSTQLGSATVIETGKSAGKILEVNNDGNLIYADRLPIAQQADILVTVGPSGDFTKIGDALKYLSTKYYRRHTQRQLTSSSTFVKNNEIAEIRLLSGFVMREQVFIVQTDLGWITITSVDPVVTIERSYLTTAAYFPNEYPAFYAGDNSVLPLIAVKFNMDNSGEGTNRNWIMVNRNSRALLWPNAGCTNAGGRGVYARESSYVDCRLVDVTGAKGVGLVAGTVSGINAHGAIIDNCYGGVEAVDGSTINVSGASIKNSGSIAVRSNECSNIDVSSADCSGAATNGLSSYNLSRIFAFGAKCRKTAGVDSTTDIVVAGGGQISCASSEGGTSVTINTLSRDGIIFK